MKKLFLVCALVIGISVFSFAQGGGGRGGGGSSSAGTVTPDQELATLKTQLPGITDDQSVKITAIFTTEAKSKDSLKTSLTDKDDRISLLTKFSAIQNAASTKIMAILTPDQAAEYQKILDQRAAALKLYLQQQGGN